MDISNINAENSDSKHGILNGMEFVEVKTENVSEDYLPVNETTTLSKSTVENQSLNIKVKKEVVEDELENSISDILFQQGSSSQIKNEYNEEKFSYEYYNIPEIKEEKEFVGTYVAELSEKTNDNGDVDEKIDIKEMHCVPNEFDEHNYTIKNENIDNERAFTQSPDDDPLKQCKEETMGINSIQKKQAKMRNCQFCNKPYAKKRSLDDHIIKNHKQEIKGDLESVITSKIHRCNICNSYETTMKDSVDRHVNLVHNEVKVKIKCEFCPELFSFKTSLHGHILSKHKDKIKNNIKSFITSKIHVCKICTTFQTTNKSNLDRHINSAHNEVKIKMKCHFCTKSFLFKASLDGHILREHKDKIKNDIKRFITNKIHVCTICNSYETAHKSHLAQHINSAHNEVKVKRKCQFCTRSFLLKTSLDGHILKKHKDKIKNDIKSYVTSKIHVCNICNSFETTHKSNLDQHINSTHNDVKIKLNCQFCIKSFALKTSLDGHILRKHKDEIKGDINSYITSTIYSCKFCAFESTMKRVLESHVTSMHKKNV